MDMAIIHEPPVQADSAAVMAPPVETPAPPQPASSAAAKQPDKASDEPLTQQTQAQIARLNQVTASVTGVRFDVDLAEGGQVVSIIERDSNEVIKTIPSEEMLAVMTRLEEVMGLLFDKRV